MKKNLSLVILVIIASIFMLCACTPTGVIQTDTETVIVISQKILNSTQNKTLEGYLDALVQKKAFSYVQENGMIVEVNGKKANALAKEYWLIYTDDTEYSNIEWGNYEYNGTQYGSATLGIKELPVKEGGTIILAISKF